MALLALSLLALALGPLLLRFVRPQGRTTRLIDAFSGVTIAGLVLLHVVPDAVNAAGWPAATGVALGLAIPLFAHRFSPTVERLSPVMAALGLAALAGHGVLDGVALSTAALEPQLAAAVVLHRLPMGLGMWWLGVSLIGRRAATIVLLTEAGATVLGFAAGEGVSTLLEGPALHCLQAFMAGMVLHVVAGHGAHDRSAHPRCDHDGPHPEPAPPWLAIRRALTWPTVVGLGLGVLSLAAVHWVE